MEVYEAARATLSGHRRRRPRDGRAIWTGASTAARPRRRGWRRSRIRDHSALARERQRPGSAGAGLDALANSMIVDVVAGSFSMLGVSRG